MAKISEETKQKRIANALGDMVKALNAEKADIEKKATNWADDAATQKVTNSFAELAYNKIKKVAKSEDEIKLYYDDVRTVVSNQVTPIWKEMKEAGCAVRSLDEMISFAGDLFVVCGPAYLQDKTIATMLVMFVEKKVFDEETFNDIRENV